MINCFKIVAKEEGLHGFFKGLAPSTVKVCVKSIKWRNSEVRKCLEGLLRNSLSSKFEYYCFMHADILEGL